MMPQITVTLDSDVLRGLERLEKGKKSKFVNAAVRYLMQNICWDRVDFMRLAMYHAWDELHACKGELLQKEDEDTREQVMSDRGQQYFEVRE
jgi:hypothetical protein